MKARTCTISLLSILLLVACGNRQATKSIAAKTDQASTQQETQAPSQFASQQQAAQQPRQPVADMQPQAVPASDGDVGTQNSAGTSFSQQAPPAAPSPFRRRTPLLQPAEGNPHAIWIPARTVLHLALNETLDTKHNRAGDRFSATLTKPILVNGAVIVPAGTGFEGHIFESKASGRFKGRAVIGLSLDSFRLAGSAYEIRTSAVARETRNHKIRNGALIGGGSGTGALIGGVAGGPAGLLIGAGAGGFAGIVGEAITGRKNLRLPVETPVAFTLRAGISIQI